MTPRHFNWSEFDSKDAQRQRIPGSGERMMNRPFVGDLDLVRQLMGQPLNVTSGYRTPAYNRIVSSTGEAGPHTTGKAADLAAAGQHAFRLMVAAVLVKAYRAGVLEEADLTPETLDRVVKASFQGIGLQQASKIPHAGRFVHLDTCTPSETNGLRPWLWSY